jgi:hypothetical protein
MSEEEKPFNVYTLIQTEAINNILNKTNDFYYRDICRWYSTTFHTPLHLVETLPWDEVLLHFYEQKWSSLPKSDQIRIAKDLIPSLYEKEENDTDEFIRQLLEQESQKKQQSLNQNKSSKEYPKEAPQSQTPQQEIFKTFEDNEEDI